MEEQGLPPEKLDRLIESAIHPQAHYRRSICKRLITQAFRQFGPESLLDMLTTIDELGHFGSVVVIDRDEIDNYLFLEHGSFDRDMFDKIQMTEEWQEFLQEMLAQSGATLGKIIDSLIEEEIGKDLRD